MEEEITKTEKQSALIPAIAVLGFGIGVTALILGIFAMKKAGDISTTMSDKIEKAAALSLEIKKLSDRTDALALQLEDLKSGDGSRVENLAKQTQSAIEKIGTILNENRRAIEENRTAIAEISKRPAAVIRQSASQAESKQTDTEASAATDGSQKIHVIASGDTFAKIAPKYGVSIEAILKANPDLNPARLKIGQKVVIPQK